MDMKPTNPKDSLGSNRLPVHLWPASATAFGCIGMANGVFRYGRNNFRETGVRASIYVDAVKRHLDDWFEGNDVDPVDQLHNFCGALASLGILVDAYCTGTLIDDRNFKGIGYRVARATMEPHVKRLRELHKEYKPKHWTIGDEHE